MYDRKLVRVIDVHAHHLVHDVLLFDKETIDGMVKTNELVDIEFAVIWSLAFAYNIPHEALLGKGPWEMEVDLIERVV